MNKATIDPHGDVSTSMRLPDIKLQSTQGEINLAKDLIGSRSVLAFYPKDLSSVCANELGVLNEALPIFNKRYNTNIYGISTDDMDSHEQFSYSLNLKFPLLTDNDPKGEVAKLFGVYDAKNDRSQRALFLFDEEGVLYWYQVYPDNINPGADGILNALDRMKLEN